MEVALGLLAPIMLGRVFSEWLMVPLAAPRHLRRLEAERQRLKVDLLESVAAGRQFAPPQRYRARHSSRP
jgi:hypothetical protein